MDLMRTLLIYLSATLTLAVQNTTAPKETPVPTPAPEAVVETAETEQIRAEIEHRVRQAEKRAAVRAAPPVEESRRRSPAILR